jgi:hypothetical protein
VHDAEPGSPDAQAFGVDAGAAERPQHAVLQRAPGDSVTLGADEERGGTTEPGKPDRQIRGLERVFQRLPAGLHPTAVAGLLRTPQMELQVDGRPRSILEWLRSGGPVEPALELIEIADWAST